MLPNVFVCSALATGLRLSTGAAAVHQGAVDPLINLPVHFCDKAVVAMCRGCKFVDRTRACYEL